MFPAVDGCEHNGIFMEVVTIQLTAVSQFENPLTDFQSSTVNFIKEEDCWLFTSFFEPVRRVKARAVALNAGQTNKITLCHLAGTPFNNRQSHIGCKLIHNLAFANTVTTTEQDRQASSAHCGGKVHKGFEVNSHLSLSLTLVYYYRLGIRQLISALFSLLLSFFIPCFFNGLI